MAHKSLWLSLLLVLALLIQGCRDEPHINIPGDPIPVIFGVFDKFDYVHYLKVGKSFQPEKDPRDVANCFDCLYFKDAEVTITFTDYRGRQSSLTPTMVENIPKDQGFFHSPGQIIYRFEKELRSFHGSLGVSVKVPGLPEATGEVLLIDSMPINTPKKGQQYIYLVPDSPLRIQWDGHPWNEIDVEFEFLEVTADTIRSAKVHIQNTNWFESPTPKYRELSINYEEFIREVTLQLKEAPEVLRRYFGYHSITISGGDINMVMYVKFMNGYNDYNELAYSNIKNGVGVMASRTTGMVDSLQFDYQTRRQLLNENRLKKYRLISY